MSQGGGKKPQADIARDYMIAAANGKGAVYWLEGSRRYGFRYPVSVEEILDVEPGKRLAYTVLRGIPVRNYRAHREVPAARLQ